MYSVNCFLSNLIGSLPNRLIDACVITMDNMIDIEGFWGLPIWAEASSFIKGMVLLSQ